MVNLFRDIFDLALFFEKISLINVRIIMKNQSMLYLREEHTGLPGNRDY